MSPWILVIILLNGSGISHPGRAITTVDFADHDLCKAAAAQVEKMAVRDTAVLTSCIRRAP